MWFGHVGSQQPWLEAYLLIGGDLKSNDKVFAKAMTRSDYLGLARAIFEDAWAKCVANVSDERDWTTVQKRVKDEGVSFLTITLPQFCNDFERSLANGVIDPTSFRNFKKLGAIPAFLQGMLGLIFDSETGRIYDKTSTATNDVPTIVDCIRQICLAFKKLELACTPSRAAAAFENFVTTEQSFKMFTLSREDLDHFGLVSSVLWDHFIRPLRVSDFSPKHGPGATADGFSGNGKYRFGNWYERIDPYFPFLEHGYSISSVEDGGIDAVNFVPVEQELPVKVIQVPKTLKGPRIIAIEPSCMQFAQQGIQAVLRHGIESYWFLSGQINFSDQGINQSLAIRGSIDGRLATIDLSDASDRVPLSLAMVMFGANWDILNSILACRSTRAKLPDGRIISPLRKFASMGSALCFPVESMYFYTICVGALLKKYDLPVDFPSVKKVGRKVHVYGDDIIISSEDATAVLDSLQKYNCKVNANKTFVTGRFRESCGADAYGGELVTPVYVRKQQPKSRQQASQLISWVATGNLFYKKGYWRTATYMFKCVERILGSLPYVDENSSVLGRKSLLGYKSVSRWNRRLHRFEVKGWSPRPVYRTDPLEGYGALNKSFRTLSCLNNDMDDARDKRHLERSARHHAVALKRGWFPVS